MRLDRIERGLFGDVKPVGGGVSELRIDHGPGYRVYFYQSGDLFVLLPCGGDKSSQKSDIEQAKSLAKRLGKGDIQVNIRSNGVRLEPDTWSHFFSEIAHLIRNSIDHGLETPEERLTGTTEILRQLANLAEDRKAA